MTRRAFSIPSLNIIGKNAADSAAIDDLLFGQILQRRSKLLKLARKQGAWYSNLYLRWGRRPFNFVRLYIVINHILPSCIIRETRGLLLAQMRLAKQEIAIARAALIGPSHDLGHDAVSKRGKVCRSLKQILLLMGRLLCRITSDALVLVAIQGYCIPFISVPPAKISSAEPDFSPSDAALCDKKKKN